MSAAFAKSLDIQVLKTDEMGVVFGWGCVCTQKGEDYYDTQGDHIPQESMLKAVVEFMEGDRIAKVMHRGPALGKVVQALALTDDIAKVFKLNSEQTGWIVGVKFYDKEVVEKFRSGEYTGFSLGGWYVENEEAA